MRIYHLHGIKMRSREQRPESLKIGIGKSTKKTLVKICFKLLKGLKLISKIGQQIKKKIQCKSVHLNLKVPTEKISHRTKSEILFKHMAEAYSSHSLSLSYKIEVGLMFSLIIIQIQMRHQQEIVSRILQYQPFSRQKNNKSLMISRNFSSSPSRKCQCHNQEESNNISSHQITWLLL